MRITVGLTLFLLSLGMNAREVVAQGGPGGTCAVCESFDGGDNWWCYDHYQGIDKCLPIIEVDG